MDMQGQLNMSTMQKSFRIKQMQKAQIKKVVLVFSEIKKLSNFENRILKMYFYILKYCTLQFTNYI